MVTKRWILSDIGGVLEIVDDDTWQDLWWERWSAAAGLERAEVDRRVDAAALPAIDVTTGTGPEFWRRLGDVLGLDAAGRFAMQDEFWDAYCGSGNTALIDYARSLRPRARLAILSNSADGAREEEERRFGFSTIFDPICYSHEQGRVNDEAPPLRRERGGASCARSDYSVAETPRSDS